MLLLAWWGFFAKRVPDKLPWWLDALNYLAWILWNIMVRYFYDIKKMFQLLIAFDVHSGVDLIIACGTTHCDYRILDRALWRVRPSNFASNTR